MESYHEYIEREAVEARREHEARLKERFLPQGRSRFDEIVSEARERCENDESGAVGFLAQWVVILERELKKGERGNRA